MECKGHNNSICRVCLKCDPNIHHNGASLLYKSDDVYIYERLNTIADVDIKPGDGLPDRICVECLLELHNAIRFKYKCETSKKVLLSAVNTNCDRGKEEAAEEIKLEEEYYIEDVEYLEDEGLHTPLDNHVTQDQQENDIKPTQTNPEKPSRALNLKLECHDCGGIFRTKCKLKVHWKKEHLRQYLTCDKCKRVFQSFKTFNDHKKAESVNCNTTYKIFNIEGTGRFRKYFCKQCDYTTTQNIKAFKHTVKHTGEKRFVCDICNKTFTQRGGLHYHKESIHKMYKMEAKCPICSKFIQGKRKLNIHMRKHKNENNTVDCEICHKTYKNAQTLKCHMERHFGKAYNCEMCSKKFSSSSSLCTHITQVHEKNADLMCPICGYKHYNKRRMNMHISKHNGDNIPCLVCGRFFKNDENLTSHMQRHNYKNYKCSKCDKVYFNKKYLIRHLFDVHEID